MKFSVFLAGPITGLSYNAASDWREQVRKQLPEGIVGLSALRGKPHLKDKSRIRTTYEEYPLTTAKGIMIRDFNDVARCDIVFVNFLGAKEISKGTLLEIGWAYAMRKPIILAIEDEGNPHDNFMVRESAGFIVNDIEKAIKLIGDVILS